MYISDVLFVTVLWLRYCGLKKELWAENLRSLLCHSVVPKTTPGVPALLCRLHVKPNNREALTCCPSASACYPETQLEIGENFNSSVYAQVFGWISSPVSPTVLDLPDYTLFKIKTPKRLLFSKVGGSILLSWALIQNQNTPSILRTYQHLWTSY